METREFAAYGYDAGSSIKGWLITAAITITIVGIITGINNSPWGFCLILFSAGIAFHIWRADYDKTLMIANRYLVLGDDIVYFRNVSVARLDRSAETLSIFSGRGRSLVISASRFPTNARKPEKIKLNRSNKFSKVAERIVAKLKEKEVQVVVL